MFAAVPVCQCSESGQLVGTIDKDQKMAEYIHQETACIHDTLVVLYVYMDISIMLS